MCSVPKYAPLLPPSGSLEKHQSTDSISYPSTDNKLPPLNILSSASFWRLDGTSTGEVTTLLQNVGFWSVLSQKIKIIYF